MKPGRKLQRVTSDQKSAVLNGVMRDWSLKTIALEAQVSHPYVCYLACAAGFRRMYVTDRERAEVMARRKAA